jgi:hypothetical protein
MRGIASRGRLEADVNVLSIDALNVKYLLVVGRSISFNSAQGGPYPPLDLDRLQVVENPYPVTPRAFFAARVTPAGRRCHRPGVAPDRSAPKNPPIRDPADQSVVEGLPAERRFSTGGTIDAAFDGDRVLVRVEPATAERFPVLNELYHPSWRAWIGGQPAAIYPTNVVMRGLVVPAGTVELRGSSRSWPPGPASGCWRPGSA